MNRVETAGTKEKGQKPILVIPVNSTELTGYECNVGVPSMCYDYH